MHARFGCWLIPLLGIVGSCGGTSRSARPDEPASGTAGASGHSNEAGRSSGGRSGDAGAAVANAGSANTNASGASSSGAAGGGAGGAPEAGGAGDASSAGAGGESNCVDVCALYGPSCCVPSVPCVAAGARCVIDVFDKEVSPTYQYADLETTVAALQPLFLVSFSTADITSTSADAPAATRLEMHLSPSASAKYGAALDGANTHPFRVTCDGQSRFVGQVYMREGAAALQTPVLHVLRDADDSVIVQLAAWQGAWASSTSPGTLAARERLDDPKLRATLCLAGALPEL